jgi:hypothetical protein
LLRGTLIIPRCRGFCGLEIFSFWTRKCDAFRGFLKSKRISARSRRFDVIVISIYFGSQFETFFLVCDIPIYIRRARTRIFQITFESFKSFCLSKPTSWNEIIT